MMFIAIKTKDGVIKGKLSFYCRMLGVSRQGVYDNLSRAETLLRNMEEKTGFLRRDEKVHSAAQQIIRAAEMLSASKDPEVGELARQILAAAKELEE